MARTCSLETDCTFQSPGLWKPQGIVTRSRLRHQEFRRIRKFTESFLALIFLQAVSQGSKLFINSRFFLCSWHAILEARTLLSRRWWSHLASLLTPSCQSRSHMHPRCQLTSETMLLTVSFSVDPPYVDIYVFLNNYNS